jgi:methionyl aminopeptidase
MREGMVFTIEPMINQGHHAVETEDDGWTVVTTDGKLSAQFEHTVAVTRDGVQVLTLRPDERSSN